MFKKIAVVLNGLPESDRALNVAIELARELRSSLRTVSVIGKMPAYAAYAMAIEPDARRDWQTYQRDLQTLHHEEARKKAEERGVEVTSHIIEGDDVPAIVHFLSASEIQLLVLGLHQHDFYIARLWNTVYDLAQEVPCSMLGVH